MEICTGLLAFIFLAFSYLVFTNYQKKKRMPPGPSGLPILGNFFSIKTNAHKAYARYMKYGDICSVRIGPTTMIVLNTYEAVKEALVEKADVFSGRPRSDLMDGVTRCAGVAFIDGPVWKEHRRFLMRTLKEFGLGKSLVEDIVREESKLLIDSLERHHGESLFTPDVFTTSVSNVISRLLFGERYGTEDPNFTTIKDGLDIVGSTSPVVFLPMINWLMRIPFFSQMLNITGFLNAWDSMHDYIRNKINQRITELQSLDAMPSNLSEANDVCDSLLIKKSREDSVNPHGHTFTEWQLIRDLLEIFGAGIDTTVTSLSWVALLLSIYPEVQKKARREIEEHIGFDRMPETADRAALPYVCAVMDEIFRYTSVAPTSLPHRTLEDTELMGYFIPANTIVQTNLYGIHHDPSLWKKPNEFYPEHFLSSDGQYCPSKYLMPFATGKRACIGEPLARTQIFIVLVAMVQNYSLKLDTKGKNLEEILNGHLGLSLRPLDHRIVFSKLSPET